MSPQEFARLCQGVTADLAELGCGSWEVVPLGGDYSPEAELCREDGARLHLTAGWRAESKVTVTAMEPSTYTGGEYYQSRKYRRHVDPARGARAIATAARTYILNAGYLEALPEQVAQNRQRIVEEGERAGYMAEAAGLFGLEGPGDAPLSLYRFTGKKAEAEIRHELLGGRPTMSVEVHGLPPEVGLAMLKAMAESDLVQARCCFTYGPEHPPQFSVAGCLYRDQNERERGEDASRERVRRFLVRSRGVRPADAYRALDEARERGAAVIEPHGQVLASVVTWDHEGCGEYTVEVPRKDGHGH